MHVKLEDFGEYYYYYMFGAPVQQGNGNGNGNGGDGWRGGRFVVPAFGGGPGPFEHYEDDQEEFDRFERELNDPFGEDTPGTPERRAGGKGKGKGKGKG